MSRRDRFPALTDKHKNKSVPRNRPEAGARARPAGRGTRGASAGTRTKSEAIFRPAEEPSRRPSAPPTCSGARSYLRAYMLAEMETPAHSQSSDLKTTTAGARARDTHTPPLAPKIRVVR
ncbi:hypothetical protein EVAR_60508_1 [Eumeta japonica]|uniref:Uncharacterized protein n=1 Tax=Eumeta variegata TaxID=151549 RepID=A0A4C1ZIA0_EUMVA|nr:hypothetical protein EVAR_60508_1 [Eumeta japonica]